MMAGINHPAAAFHRPMGLHRATKTICPYISDKFHYYIVFSNSILFIVSYISDKFRYYIVFSNSILFILGLVFSYKLVEKALLDILITHLTDEWEDYSMRKAAMLVNLQEGTEAVLQVFLAFIADAYMGLFRMVVCSTTLYVIGLLLSCLAAWIKRSLNLRVFYSALVLMTLSQAAKKVTLKAFLGDQLMARDQPATEEEEERARLRCSFWWNSISFLAGTVALFGPSRIDSLKALSMVSAIAMGVAFLWFLLGTRFYTRVEPTGSPIGDIASVINSAIIKRKVEYPQSPEQLLENSTEIVQISPQVAWLRWLDKAAVVQQEQGKGGHDCTVEQVKGVKYLIKMIPMWTTFLTFSLVAASGSTFFLEEATSITDKNFPILFFINLQTLTEFVVSEISDYVLEKMGKKKNNLAQRMMLVRIGFGMICCVLCCLIAWTNAVHRLHLVRKHGKAMHHMSVFRLTPQYLLLATMEGLSKDGLESFLNSQVSKSIAGYGPPFGECVMGVGKFLSAVCMIIFSRWEWFEDDVNCSRLDKYYARLAILSCTNLVLYWLVAYWYGDDKFLAEDAVDIEMAISSVETALKVVVSRSRSLTWKGQHNFSARIFPITEGASFSGKPHAQETAANTDKSKKQCSFLHINNFRGNICPYILSSLWAFLSTRFAF